MDSTIFFARIMGVYALVEGASMLVRRRMLLGVFAEMAKSRALSYIVGVCILIIGLLLALSHSTFESGLSSVITIVGWGVLLEGVLFLFLSKSTLDGVFRKLNSPIAYYTIAFGYLALGAYLTTAGFSFW